MSFAPTINFVLERALRKIGATAITSPAARAREMVEARYWLDMVVGHLAGRERTWWLVPRTATFLLVAGKREYDLNEAVGIAQAPDGIEFVVAVYIDDATTGAAVGDVNLLRREEYEAEVGETINAVGVPSGAYIDRAQRPTLMFLHAPGAGRSYRARVVFQSYAPNLVSTRDLKLLERFRSAWTLWLVTATAAQIGNGPVRKLPKDEVDDMKRDAGSLLFDLESYEGHEQNNQPSGVQFHNGV